MRRLGAPVMTTPDNVALGAALARERRRAGWSRRRLAERLSVAASDLATLEAGEAHVRASILVRAAKSLERPPGAFLHTAAEMATAKIIGRLDASTAELNRL